jgi:hypothetical protein
MSHDDGLCHICRRVPQVQAERYSFTTCERCEDLDEDHQLMWWQAVWLWFTLWGAE